MSFPLVICEKCGSSYAEMAWPNLRVPPPVCLRYQRIGNRIHCPALCICETDTCARLEKYSLKVPVPDAWEKVIVQWRMRDLLATPNRCTPKRVVLQVNKSLEITFDLKTGDSIKTKGYSISEEERKIALRLLDAPKTE